MEVRKENPTSSGRLPEVMEVTYQIGQVESGIRYILGTLTKNDKVKLEELLRQLDEEFKKIMEKKSSSLRARSQI